MPKFSFNLYGIPTEQLVPIAISAEEKGFDAVWLGDHVLAPRRVSSVYPYAKIPGGNPLDEPVLSDVWVAIGAMLACTEKLRVGTGVYVLPQRSPFTTALAASTAQNLSKGRLVLGVGAGWLEQEFMLLEQSFANRGARTDEIIDILRILWRGGFQSHEGPVYSFNDVRTEAATYAVPIVIGGHSPAAIRRAAMRGDGWYSTEGLTLDEIVTVRDRIDAGRLRAGRASLPFEYHVRLAPTATLDVVLRFIDDGFEHLVIGVGSLWREAGATTVDARIDVLSRLRDDLLDPAR